jgi:hypothetical protein
MTKAMLLFLVTSIALGLISLHLVRELRAERANAEALQARVSALEQAKAAQPVPTTPFATWSVQKLAAGPVSARTPPNASDNQALNAALQAAADSIPAPNAAQAEQTRFMQEHMERQRALMSDPEYRDALRVQQRMSFVRSHPDLAHELGLTAEQTDQLFSLMADHAIRNMDNSQALMSFDPTADPSIAEKAHRKAMEQQKAHEAQIAQLLGPQKFKAYQEYQSTLHIRYQATELSQLLASNGAPLDRELTKPLIKVLAQEHQRMAQEQQKAIEAAARSGVTGNALVGRLSPYDDANFDRTAEYQRRTREALATILTPEQLEIYAKDQDANMHVQRAQMRVMRAQQPPDPTNVGVQGDWAVATPMVVGETVMFASPAVAVPVPPPDEN